MQLQVQQQQITGFSYAFTALLLKKFRGLLESEELWVVRNNLEHDEDRGPICDISDIGYIVWDHLYEQVGRGVAGLGVPQQDNLKDFRDRAWRLIKVVEEFLSIF